jgi:putative endonuclease
MTYYVYMLKNIDRLKSKTYVGFTNNLVKRLNLHNSNKGAKSTKGYKWIVIYKKRFINKSKALSYEYTLKKNRKLRNQIFNEFK